MNLANLALLLLALGAGYFILRMLITARPSISPAEASAAIEAGDAVLIDVREPDEWADGVAAPAALLPLSDLRGRRERWRPFLAKLGGKRIFVYCHSGARSGMAASILKSEGFDAANVGGFARWSAQGLPVRRP